MMKVSQYLLSTLWIISLRSVLYLGPQGSIAVVVNLGQVESGLNLALLIQVFTLTARMSSKDRRFRLCPLDRTPIPVLFVCWVPPSLPYCLEV
jgi:hypothetical protein